MESRRDRPKKDHGRLDEIEGEEDEIIHEKPQIMDMGYTITPFNLSNEKEDGYYDGNGTFIWKKNVDDEQQEDAWLDVSKQTIQQTKEAYEKRQQNDTEKEEEWTELKAYQQLLKVMQSTETIKECIQRLRPIKTEKKRRKIDRSMRQATTEEETVFTAVILAADYLVRQGNVSIYEWDRKRIINRLKEMTEKETTSLETIHEEKARPRRIEWEYQGDDQQIYGPFTTLQILEWKENGYFNETQIVQIRQTVSPWMHELMDEEDQENPWMHELMDEEDQENPWMPSNQVSFEDYL